MSVDNTSLHVLNGVFAERRTWRCQVDTKETRSCAAQCLSRDHQAGSDGPTQEVSLRGNDIEGGRCAKGNDDGWSSVKMMSSNVVIIRSEPSSQGLSISKLKPRLSE